MIIEVKCNSKQREGVRVRVRRDLISLQHAVHSTMQMCQETRWTPANSLEVANAIYNGLDAVHVGKVSVCVIR